jgi:hypothetical protein
MPSADFCAAVRSPCGNLSPVAETQRRPPEVRSAAFTARPPDLPPRPLMTVDFAISCSLVRSGRPRYPVLVHRAAVLLHASFRPRLATTPLRFADPSPPSGWIEDSHLQAVDHARHTTNGGHARLRAARSSGLGPPYDATALRSARSGVDPGAFLVRPFDRRLGRHALNGLRVHVGDDVFGHHFRGLAVGRAGVSRQAPGEW